MNVPMKVSLNGPVLFRVTYGGALTLRCAFAGMIVVMRALRLGKKGGGMGRPASGVTRNQR
jgi:hypothetical protein